jgi:hypothetical protein
MFITLNGAAGAAVAFAASNLVISVEEETEHDKETDTEIVRRREPLTCSFDVNVKDRNQIKEFIREFAPEPPQYEVQLHSVPKTKFKRSYEWYITKYKQATSIRRSRKFARVIGMRCDRTLKYKFKRIAPGRVLVFPKCTIKSDIVRFEDSRKCFSRVNIQCLT